jgi:hypothetical protein
MSCQLCDHPQRVAIDAQIASGATAEALQKWMEDQGFEAPHRNTISKHKIHHIRAFVIRQTQVVAARAHRLNARSRTSQTDLAELVRDDVVDAMASGELRPTISEGLRAQELLDRRMEKQGDRDLIIGFLEALGGEPLALPIEGVYAEIGPGE